MVKTEAGLRKLEADFDKIKADFYAGKVDDRTYRKAKADMVAKRAKYRAEVRDKDGYSPVKTGD